MVPAYHDWQASEKMDCRRVQELRSLDLRRNYMAMAEHQALECFADPDELEPNSDKCASCMDQAACEEEARIRYEEAQARQEEEEGDMFSRGGVASQQFQQRVAHLHAIPRQQHYAEAPDQGYDGGGPGSYYTPPQHHQQQSRQTYSCEGVTPVPQAPRQDGETIIGRLIKNVALGSLARALTESTLVAEDERRRPVGDWGRNDRERK